VSSGGSAKNSHHLPCYLALKNAAITYLVMAQLLNRSLHTEQRSMPSVISNMSASSGFIPVFPPLPPAPLALLEAPLSFFAPFTFASSRCRSILCKAQRGPLNRIL
jgi:hypothetical protein